MSKTVGELIAEKYVEFSEEAKKILGDKVLLPSLKEIDLADLFILIEMLFPDDKTNDNLKNVLNMKRITMSDEEFSQMLILVDNMLVFIKDLKTKQ